MAKNTGKTSSKRGGKRPGSGRKRKYDEPTALLSARIPVSLMREIDARAEALDQNRTEYVANALRSVLRRQLSNGVPKR